jgi:DNA-binding NtrC family response regulator
MPVAEMTRHELNARTEHDRSARDARLSRGRLHQARGNRTHAARALGLQRTYLLRLIRDLGVAAPPPPPRRRRSAA